MVRVNWRFSRWLLPASLLLVSSLFATPTPRTVCVTYCSYHPNATVPLMAAEPIFHGLGLNAVYCDLAEGTPPSHMEILAVVDWFTGDSLPDPVSYLRWVGSQMERGVRYLSLGRMAALKRSDTGKMTSQREVVALFRRLGLHYQGDRTDRPGALQILYKEPTTFDYERALSIEDLPRYCGVVSGDRRNKIHLVVKRTDKQYAPSVGAMTGPWGGYALEGALLYAGEGGQMRWHVNPHLFFRAALGVGPCRFDYWSLGDNPVALEGFERGRIEWLQDGSWSLSQYGECRTLVLEGEHRYPDLDRSSGIVGYERHEGSLSLYLAPEERARLFLTERTPTLPHLVGTLLRIEKWRCDGHRLLFTGQLRCGETMEIGGYPPRARLAIQIIPADKSARPTRLTMDTDERGHIAIECHVEGKFGMAIMQVSDLGS